MADPAATPKPADYWDDPALKLAKGSLDEKYAKAKKAKANAPGTYVSDLQRDLILLGYLKAGSDDGSYGAGTERVVQRFQRHAARKFRMVTKTTIPATPQANPATGACDQTTAKEVRIWIAKGYTLPIGVHQIVAIDGGKMRDDVAKLWKETLDDAATKGAMIVPTGAAKSDFYSDTWRNPINSFSNTGGNSKFSLHYTGRAVDLSMDPAGGKHQRWWVAKETINGDTWWRIYCKTDQQDGSQGTKIAAKTTKHHDLYDHKEKTIPEGYYVDLTALLDSHGFIRIKAQKGWESKAKKQEWWHFHYTEGLQDTFLDEMELIGYTEAQIKQSGRTTADMDHPPG